jgi:hypothetical protein
MSVERFVVEADRKVVGIAVKDRGGFRFFASDKEYQDLDRILFPRAKMLANKVAQLGRKRGLPAYRRAPWRVQ